MKDILPKLSILVILLCCQGITGINAQDIQTEINGKMMEKYNKYFKHCARQLWLTPNNTKKTRSAQSLKLKTKFNFIQNKTMDSTIFHEHIGTIISYNPNVFDLLNFRFDSIIDYNPSNPSNNIEKHTCIIDINNNISSRKFYVSNNSMVILKNETEYFYTGSLLDSQLHKSLVNNLNMITTSATYNTFDANGDIITSTNMYLNTGGFMIPVTKDSFKYNGTQKSAEYTSYWSPFNAQFIFNKYELFSYVGNKLEKIHFFEYDLINSIFEYAAVDSFIISNNKYITRYGYDGLNNNQGLSYLSEYKADYDSSENLILVKGTTYDSASANYINLVDSFVYSSTNKLIFASQYQNSFTTVLDSSVTIVTYNFNDDALYTETSAYNNAGIFTQQASQSFFYQLPNAINETPSLKEIILYPNPAGNSLILSDFYEEDELVFYNVLGQKIIFASPIVTNIGLKYDLSTLPNGEYFIMNTKAGFKSAKFLKIN